MTWLSWIALFIGYVALALLALVASTFALLVAMERFNDWIRRHR